METAFVVFSHSPLNVPRRFIAAMKTSHLPVRTSCSLTLLATVAKMPKFFDRRNERFRSGPTCDVLLSTGQGN
jgi:hypothetical protein